MRTRCRQGDDDPGLLLDDGGGQLDEVQPQRVELGAAPWGFPWTGGAQFPPEPVGAAMQHQAHLVGVRLRARRAVRGEMGLPGLDVVLGLAARGVELLVEMLAATALEIGDDVAGIPESVRSFV